MEFTKLNGHSIVRWVGTEMALSGGGWDTEPVVWEHSSVPYLQLISIDVLLADRSVYRVCSQLDDGSGNYGLLLSVVDALDTPSIPDVGSIYRTRDLIELPVGVATVAITEIDGADAVLRVEIAAEGRTISLWVAEVYERDGGLFDVVGCDESILVQVDGARPRQYL
ncbi:MAG TPA: hypothetical protein VGD52_25955 [Pseudoduganella sp.]